MPIRPIVRAAILASLAALASCAGGSGPVHYTAQSSSYPAPGPPGDPWGPYISEASQRFGVPSAWIRAVMHQESGGHEYLDGQPITSGAGAMGLMQLMPDTYADLQAQYGLGGDPYDPHDNILAGTAYIRQMYNKYGSPGFLAAYNAGPARVDDYLAGVADLPAETVNYVASITPHLGGDTAPVALASAAPMERPAYAAPAPSPARVASAGCAYDPDAAYDPSRPCSASIVPAERPDPVSTACVADPDAAFNPAYPCMTGPVVQTVSYEAPRSSAPVAPALPASALGMAAAPEAPPLSAAPIRAAPADGFAPAPARFVRSPVVSGGAWKIQVGAFGQRQAAGFAIDIARDALERRFGPVRQSVEPVEGLGGHLLYRARLAGLDHAEAGQACEMLRGRGLPCLLVEPGA